jgi:hypothetical protein
MSAGVGGPVASQPAAHRPGVGPDLGSGSSRVYAKPITSQPQAGTVVSRTETSSLPAQRDYPAAVHPVTHKRDKDALRRYVAHLLRPTSRVQNRLFGIHPLTVSGVLTQTLTAQRIWIH